MKDGFHLIFQAEANNAADLLKCRLQLPRTHIVNACFKTCQNLMLGGAFDRENKGETVLGFISVVKFCEARKFGSVQCVKPRTCLLPGGILREFCTRGQIWMGT